MNPRHAIRAVLVVSLVAAPSARADTVVVNPFSGTWATQFGSAHGTGSVKFKAISAADGNTLLQSLGGTSCAASATFYRGDYSDPSNPHGVIGGCTTSDASHLAGRFRSDSGGDGDVAIAITAPGQFAGNFTYQGSLYPYSGTFQSHFDGDGCCTESTPPPQATPTPPPDTTPPPPTSTEPATKQRITFKNGHFEPHEATVASGAVIKVCDTGTTFVSVFSYSGPAAKHSTLEKVDRPNHAPEFRLPGKGKRTLKPGECDHFIVRNPTKKPIELKLFSEFSSFAKMILTVAPESR